MDAQQETLYDFVGDLIKNKAVSDPIYQRRFRPSANPASSTGRHRRLLLDAGDGAEYRPRRAAIHFARVTKHSQIATLNPLSGVT